MTRILAIVCLVMFTWCSVSLSAAEPSAVPAEIRKEMAYLVGQWEYEWTEAGETWVGRYTARWAAGGNCLLLSSESDRHNDVAVSSWDPKSGEMVEVWSGKTGTRLELRYTIEKGKDWVGTSTETLADGTQTQGGIRVRKKGPNSFIYTRTVADSTRTIVMKKLPAANTPELSALASFEGKWSAKTSNGGRRVWVFEWSPYRDSLRNQMIAYSPDGKVLWSLNARVTYSERQQRYSNAGKFGEQDVEFIWRPLDNGAWESKAVANDRKWVFTPKGTELLYTSSVDGDNQDDAVLTFERQ